MFLKVRNIFVALSAVLCLGEFVFKQSVCTLSHHFVLFVIRATIPTYIILWLLPQ